MDDKNIDGIKKLGKEELEKSRKIILDTIGETEKKSAPEAKPSISKMDGIIKMDKVKSLISEVDKELRQAKNDNPLALDQKADKTTESARINFLTAVENSDIKIVEPAPDREPPAADTLIKPIIAPKPVIGNVGPDVTKREIIDKTKIDNFKRELAKKEEDLRSRKEAEIAKQKAIEVKKIMLAKQKEEEKRKQAELKIIKQETRHKRISSLKINFQRSLINFLFLLKSSPRKTMKLLFLALVLLIFSYSIIAFVIIKMHLDNPTLRLVAAYIPVPALITQNEIVEYYAYQDIKNALKSTFNNNNADISTKIYIIQLMILNDLNDKYRAGLIIDDVNNLENFKNGIADKIIYDEDINQVPLNRIKKIRQNVADNKNEFNYIGAKYGDKIGEIIVTAGKSQYEYYNQIQNLNAGEVSAIVYTKEGYYLFRCYSKSYEKSLYSYVFVQAKTLDQYIQEKAKDFKIISLVE